MPHEETDPGDELLSVSKGVHGITHQVEVIGILRHPAGSLRQVLLTTDKRLAKNRQANLNINHLKWLVNKTSRCRQGRISKVAFILLLMVDDHFESLEGKDNILHSRS